MTKDVEDVFASALNFDDYRDRMRVHAGPFADVYARLAFVREREQGQAPLGTSRILVLTEDFCIDSVLNLPLLARLAEASSEAKLRVASLNAHEALASRFPGRGGVPRLPTAIFLEADGRVKGYWSERSAMDRDWMASFLLRDPMPELILDRGRPTPVLDAWMGRRLAAQRPFQETVGWTFTRDELAAIAWGGS